MHLTHSSAKLKMQTLSQSLDIENMKKMIMLLRLTIENAINKNISKRRSYNQSKVWWSKVLIDKKTFTVLKRKHWNGFEKLK